MLSGLQLERRNFKGGWVPKEKEGDEISGAFASKTKKCREGWADQKRQL